MFKKLDKYEVKDSLIWFDMPELGENAQLLLAHAGESNKPYYSAMLNVSGKRVRALGKKSGIDADDTRKSREEDMELFPIYIIRDWRGVEGDPDAPGEVELVDGMVPFSRANAKKLCKALPYQLFDNIRTEANTIERFYTEDIYTPPDATELAGN